MQTKIVSMLIVVVALSGGLFIKHTARAETSRISDEYVCPPCGCGVDDRVFDKEGLCPACGMKLVVKGSLNAPASPAPPREAPKKVAILIFDGVEIIDYTGPWEVFGGVGMKVFTVSTSTAPIKTSMGMTVTPDYALEDAPAADVLLIPGGGVVVIQNDARVLNWIRERSQQTTYVMSVCNGAYILAKTGLLDGLTATTTAPLQKGLSIVAPKVNVTREQRYVDNGKFITTAGLSSGIDGALHLVEKLFGHGQAQLDALGLEYDWSSKNTFARANLADRHIAKILGWRMELDAQGKLLSTEGTTRNWEVKWQAPSNKSAADLLKQLNSKLSEAGWVEQSTSNPKSLWKFNDEDGGQWAGITEINGSNPATIDLKIERTGAAPAKTSAKAIAAAEQLVIRDAWIPEMPPGTKSAGAHMVIENQSGTATALLGAKAEVAGAVELHRAEVDNGMMRMKHLDRIAVPVGKTELTGELHIMLINLKAPLKEGDQVALTLEFEGGVSKNVTVPVRKRPAE